MNSILELALADIARHPDSTVREISGRIGIEDRHVYAVLGRAAHDGKCQRWKRTRTSPWLWEIPPCPNEPHD